MNNDKNIFHSKIKTRWPLMIFVLIWFLGCITAIGVLGIGMIEHPSRIKSMVFFMIPLLIAALLVFNYIRYQLTGEETLIIGEEKMEGYRSGTWFKKQFSLTYFEVTEIEMDYDNDNPMWKKFWGFGGGKIRIKYLGRDRRFGQDLTRKEALQIFPKIKAAFLEKRTNVNND